MTMDYSNYYSNTIAMQPSQSHSQIYQDKIQPSYSQDDGRFSGIQYPGQHDVLSGRGGHAMAHSGNLKFRILIDNYKARFQAADKSERMDIANGILATWRGLNPTGRFLTKTEPLKEDSLWEDIGNKAALKKISQALREKRSYPMVANTPAKPDSNPNLPAHAAQAQGDHAEQIRKIEAEIERLKMQNAEQQKIQQQLLASQGLSQFQSFPHPHQIPVSPEDTPSHHRMVSPQPSPPSSQDDAAMDYTLEASPDSQHPPFQPSFAQVAAPKQTSFPPEPTRSSSNSRPPLAPRAFPSKKNALMRVFSNGSGSGGSNDKQDKQNGQHDQRMSGSSEDTTNRKLMNEDLGSFSGGSGDVGSPSMDSTDRRHVRLNSNNSSKSISSPANYRKGLSLIRRQLL